MGDQRSPINKPSQQMGLAASTDLAQD